MADSEYIAADTTVVSHLTKVSEHSEVYNAMLGTRRLAIPFQTRAELIGAGFGPARTKRVGDLLAASLKLPHSESTDVWYSRVIQKRKELKGLRRPGADAGEGDVWVIANALEYGLPMLSHDAQQVSLGRAMGLRVLTNLEGLRAQNPIV